MNDMLKQNVLLSRQQRLFERNNRPPETDRSFIAAAPCFMLIDSA
jgi:hypothetical protein